MTGAGDKTNTVVGVNIKREMVLSPNDEEVPNSSKKHIYPIQDYSAQNIPYFRPKWSKLNNTLFQTRTAEKPYSLAPHIPI